MRIHYPRFDHSSFQPVIVLSLISVFILPAIVFYPFHSDVDIHQVMGFELFRFHGLPYLATWDSNFPGTILIHATAIALFGNSEIGLHIMDVLIQIAIVILLYKISRFWLGQNPALFGCILYTLFYVHGPGQYMSQRDCFAILPILLTIWAYLNAFRTDRQGVRNAEMFCAGLFTGLAVWIRPTFGLLLLVPFVSLFDLRTRAGLYALLFEVFGFSVIILIGLIPYAIVPHGLQEIYLAMIRYNYDVYVHTYSPQDHSPRAWLALAFVAVWAASMIVHKRRGRVSMFKPNSSAEVRFLIATIAAIAIGIIVMRRLAIYHFAPFFACFMPVIAAMVWETLQSFRWRRAGLIAAIAVAAIILYPWRMAGAFFSSTHSYSSFVQRFDRDYDAGTTGAAAVYVERHSQPLDAVEVASFTPGLRWRIDRPFVTRYTTPQPLFDRAPDGEFTDYQLKWRKEYVDQISQPRARFYIVDNASDSVTSVMKILMTLPGLQSVIDHSFQLDTVIGTYYIYSRK